MQEWMFNIAIAGAGAAVTFGMLRQMVLNLKDSVGKLEDKIQALKNSPKQIDRLKREMLETDDKLDVLKSFVDKNTPLIANITDSEKRVTDSVNELWKQHSALDNKVGQLPSMKDIRAEYVQKTIAQQSNEHLNTTLEKIENVVNGLAKEQGTMQQSLTVLSSRTSK